MFSFFTRSDLVEVGRTEDGEAVVAESHYVVAERADGARWYHDHRFLSVVAAGSDPEYGIPVFHSVDAATEVEAFLAKVEAARGDLDDLDPAYWARGAASYGSPAGDENDLISFERKMEHR